MEDKNPQEKKEEKKQKKPYIPLSFWFNSKPRIGIDYNNNAMGVSNEELIVIKNKVSKDPNSIRKRLYIAHNGEMLDL